MAEDGFFFLMKRKAMKEKPLALTEGVMPKKKHKKTGGFYEAQEWEIYGPMSEKKAKMYEREIGKILGRENVNTTDYLHEVLTRADLKEDKPRRKVKRKGVLWEL